MSRHIVRAAALLAVGVGLSAFIGAVGAESLGIGQPVRLALTASGNLLISNHGTNLVVEWNPDKAKVVRSFAIAGRPSGIATAWGKLFVGNEITRSVEVYTRKGRLNSVLGGAPGQVARPNAIAIDAGAGLVFVLDTATTRVLVYDSAGVLLRTLPAPGAEPLYRPASLTVDPALGEVLVSDFGPLGSFSANPRVTIYDYQGNYLAQIRGKRGDSYAFAAPQGLTVNRQGLVYLVDAMRGQVLVFDRDTQQGVAVIGEAGRAPGNLLFPLDVKIDAKTADVYVANHRLGRIEVFTGKGMLP